MGKTAAEFLTKLLESPVSLLILGGFVILILGLSGGVTYKNWLPIESGWPQTTAIAIGVLALISGIFLIMIKPLSPKPYGITIKTPTRDQEVKGLVRVEGKIRKLPSAKYELWLLRVYHNGEFLPMRHVNLTRGEEDWSVADFDVGSGSQYITVAACLVGQSGQALFDYFRAAGRRHNRWMDQLKIRREEPERYLPNLERSIMSKVEMIECDRVRAKIS